MEAGSILGGMETHLMHQNQRANEAEVCVLPLKTSSKRGFKPCKFLVEIGGTVTNIGDLNLCAVDFLFLKRKITGCLKS
jgi:hypothetical protein